MKDYYGLLEVAPTASQDDVKRAFRLQIARYHPDKVQHLGREFQAMAAERAAELTEAYRILSDQERRAEYDRARGTGTPAARPVSAPAPPSPPPDAAAPEAQTPPDSSFAQERATRDEYVRKATLGRFRQAFESALQSDYDESSARGFDVAFVPKAKLFGRVRGPRLLGRCVPRVDAAAVAQIWGHVGRLHVPSNEEVCVFLMGTDMAPRRELEEAISAQRRKARDLGPKVSLIPINIRVWDAHVPVDAPAPVKNLLARLRTGT